MTDEEVWDLFNDFSAEVAHTEKLLDDNDLRDVDLADLNVVQQKWNAVLMALALYQGEGEEDGWL